MLNKKIESALNKQINVELFTAYQFLSMSAYLAENNLSGFSSWLKKEFEKEQSHATKLFDYIVQRGGKVDLAKIETPKREWKGIIDLFEDILKNEEKLTSEINDLINLAIGEKDHASSVLLQWYVSTQVKEEAEIKSLLVHLNAIEGKGPGLLMLDREAGSR